MYLCIVIGSNKCATGRGGGADSSGGCVSVRSEDKWKTSVLPAQFCYEPKMALKNKVYIF